MVTNTDIKEYSTNDMKETVLKTVTIKGEAGKQIKIESTSIQLYSSKDKIVNNTVVAINGEPWAAWNWDDAGYSDTLTYNRYPHLVDAGEDAVITWTVKPSGKYNAKMKNASYTYSYVDVDSKDTVDTSVKYLVEIECVSSEKAKAAIEEIKSKGILKDDMAIYIAERV